MQESILKKFEEALKSNSSSIYCSLVDGTSEKKILRLLKKAGVERNIEELLVLFKWKNGISLNSNTSRTREYFLPGTNYCLDSIESAYVSYSEFPEAAEPNPPFRPYAVGYFPFLWDWGTEWIALGLDDKIKGEVFELSLHSSIPCKKIFESMDDLFSDATDTLIRGGRMQCFNTTVE